MKKILLAALVSLSLAPSAAFADPVTKQSVSALVKRIKANIARVKAKRLKAGAIVNYNVTPSNPQQGDQVFLFASANSGFDDQELVLEGSLNGTPVSLEHPATELWLHDMGTVHEIREHTFSGTLYIQNREDAEALRGSIAQLEGEIQTLNQQIADATDPAIIAELTALRDEKVSLKNQLVQALANLKAPVGVETFEFRVRAKNSGTEYPRISGITPNVVGVNQAKAVTISGENFGLSPTVLIGGQEVEVTSSGPQEIIGTFPGTSLIGAKHVEVRFANGTQVKNAFLNNGFFVTANTVGDQAPVAVASAVNSEVPIGSLAEFSSVNSYDPEGEAIRFEWRLISKPTESALEIPTNPPETNSAFSVMPDVPGHYVAELKVFESAGQQQGSYASLAVVHVLSHNDVPYAAAPPIVTSSGVAGFSQIDANDPDPNQSLSFSIAVPPANGQASVTETGLVTYMANTGFIGSDSLQVAVTDNGNPPQSAFVNIPVTVAENLAPVASAPSITVGIDASGTAQITASDPNPGQTLSYSISAAPLNGTASVSGSGLVEYVPNSGFLGSDSIEVVVADNGAPSLSTSVLIPVEVVTNLPPVIPSALFYTIRTRGVPYQVGMTLTGNPAGSIYDPDGTIASMEWDFGDGTKEKTTDQTFAFLLHNYMALGSYNATLRVKDNLGAETSRQIVVNVVDTDIPTAKFTADPSNGGGGIVPLTVTFDASASEDTDGIVQYRWRWGSGSDEVTSSPIITHTFTAPGDYSVRLRTQDANQARGESIVTIKVGATVSGAQPQAQFLIGPPRELLVGGTASFDAIRSFNPNVGGSLAAFNWNFNDFGTCGGPTGGCTGTGLTATYVYPEAVNYFPNLQAQSEAGTLSQRVFQEIFVVTTGHAPKAVLRASTLSGIAPLQVDFSGGESYDYDGAVESYDWVFGDGSSPVCAPECDNQGASVQHTYQNSGVYLARLTVTDSDGNRHFTTTTINVAASRAELVRKAPRTEFDPEREYQRQILTNACSTGSGEACSYLADMYQEDGNQSMATQLKARACSLGYAAACGAKMNTRIDQKYSEELWPQAAQLAEGQRSERLRAHRKCGGKADV